VNIDEPPPFLGTWKRVYTLVTSGEVEELQKRMRSTLGGEANAAFNLEPRSSVYLIVQTPDGAATSGQVAAHHDAAMGR